MNPLRVTCCQSLHTLHAHSFHTSAYVGTRQHTSAYVGTHQHTSAYVCSSALESVARDVLPVVAPTPTPTPTPTHCSTCTLLPPGKSAPLLLAASTSTRQHTSAYVSIRQHTSAPLLLAASTIDQNTQHTSARQHTSAYARIPASTTLTSAESALTLLWW